MGPARRGRARIGICGKTRRRPAPNSGPSLGPVPHGIPGADGQARDRPCACQDRAGTRRMARGSHVLFAPAAARGGPPCGKALPLAGRAGSSQAACSLTQTRITRPQRAGRKHAEAAHVTRTAKRRDGKVGAALFPHPPCEWGCAAAERMKENRTLASRMDHPAA